MRVTNTEFDIFLISNSNLKNVICDNLQIQISKRKEEEERGLLEKSDNPENTSGKTRFPFAKYM